MKIVLVLALFVVGIFAEYCDHERDCTDTVCGTNFRLDCYEYGGSHVCTCIQTSGGSDVTCTSPSQCSGECHQDNHQWHCVDGHCHCGNGFGR